jgi:hypothetical protein|nr:hypothetical protein [Kofleriaceae bacterium]
MPVDLRPLHPLEHHPSFRAMIAAAPPIATLASRLNNGTVARELAIACGDLALGFAALPGSRERVAAHHRAWVRIRQIEKIVVDAAHKRLASPEILARARRAVDRADVLVAALPGVLPC